MVVSQDISVSAWSEADKVYRTREIRTIIRGLEGINFAAADIVEVAPAYDTNAELTTMVCYYRMCAW